MDIAVVTSSVRSKETEAFVLKPHLSMSDHVALIPSTGNPLKLQSKGAFKETNVHYLHTDVYKYI